MKIIVIATILMSTYFFSIKADSCEAKIEITPSIVRDKTTTEIGLNFSVRNTGENDITVSHSMFDRDSITLTLVSNLSILRYTLKEVSYFSSVSLGNTVLKPNENYSATIDLGNRFEDLTKDLKMGSVIIFWYADSENSASEFYYAQGGNIVLPKVISIEHEGELEQISKWYDRTTKDEKRPRSIEEINAKLKTKLELKECELK